MSKTRNDAKIIDVNVAICCFKVNIMIGFIEFRNYEFQKVVDKYELNSLEPKG